ncbi:hypothetical protein BsWGS_08743 [Bradybaena similaris]
MPNLNLSQHVPNHDLGTSPYSCQQMRSFSTSLAHPSGFRVWRVRQNSAHPSGFRVWRVGQNSAHPSGFRVWRVGQNSAHPSGFRVWRVGQNSAHPSGFRVWRVGQNSAHPSGFRVWRVGQNSAHPSGFRVWRVGQNSAHPSGFRVWRGGQNSAHSPCRDGTLVLGWKESLYSKLIPIYASPSSFSDLDDLNVTVAGFSVETHILHRLLKQAWEKLEIKSSTTYNT